MSELPENQKVSKISLIVDNIAYEIIDPYNLEIGAIVQIDFSECGDSTLGKGVVIGSEIIIVMDKALKNYKVLTKQKKVIYTLYASDITQVGHIIDLIGD